MKRQKGSALLIAILTTTSILIMVLGISRLVIPQIEQNHRLTDALVADYAAKAGIEYFKQNPSIFTTNITTTKNLDTNLSTCDSRKERCFTIKPVIETNPDSGNKFRVAVVSLNDSQPKINQGIFGTMNKMLVMRTTGNQDQIKASQKIIDVIGGANYSFENPHPDNPTSCGKWLKKLDWLLKNPNDLMDYDLLYITNGTTNLSSGSVANGELDFKPFFDHTKYSFTLGDYLKAGKHLFIDNAYGAVVSFPSITEFNNLGGIYFDTLLANVGFSWSNIADGNYRNEPGFINGSLEKPGVTNTEFDGPNTIFKYVNIYAQQNLMTINTAMKEIIDNKLQLTRGGWVDDYYPIISTNAVGFPLMTNNGSGYTEMAPFGDQNKINIAMQYFGDYTKGWIILASSSPGTMVTAQGATDVDLCNINDIQSEDVVAPYMFIFSVAEFSTKLRSVNVTGTYGNVQRTYRATPEIDNTNRLKISWKEIAH